MVYKNRNDLTIYQREWARLNSTHRNFVRRKRTAEKRLLAINLLGGKCKKCDCENTEVLQIDHIVPIGRRSKLGSNSGASGLVTYESVIKSHNRKDVYQVLCANCHMEKTRLNGEHTGKVQAEQHIETASEFQLLLFNEEAA